MSAFGVTLFLSNDSSRSSSSEFETHLHEYLKLCFREEWETEWPVVTITRRQKLDRPPTVVEGRAWQPWEFECMVAKPHWWRPQRCSRTLYICDGDITEIGMLWLGQMAEQYEADTPRRQKQIEYEEKYRQMERVVVQRFASDPTLDPNVTIGELIEREIGPRP